MRPWLPLVVAAAALASGGYSLATAATSKLDPGVAVDDKTGVVRSVDPQGFAWAFGVRPGDRVEAIHPSDEPGGYAITVATADGDLVASERGPEFLLRIASPLALGAVGAALYAWRRSRKRDGSSVTSACAAFALAALPLHFADPGLPSAAIVLAGVVAPPSRIMCTTGRPTTGTAVWLATAVAVGSMWTYVRMTHSWAPMLLGTAAASLTVAGAIAMTAAGAGLTRTRLKELAHSRHTSGVVAVVGTAVLGATIAGQWTPPVGVVAAITAAIVLLLARPGVAGVVDRVLLAGTRERAALRAAEEERARLARDLHDDPLQALSGVIRSLDDAAVSATSVRESLNTVATRLRAVTMDLRPAALDDLGLVPAIEDACRNVPGLQVCVALANETGRGPEARPPAEVEIAAYRIAQEAIANASKHAAGGRLLVQGRVAQGIITLAFLDDRPGLPPSRIPEALADGRLGIASMRHRAGAIDARLGIESGPTGTTVRLEWTA